MPTNLNSCYDKYIVVKEENPMLEKIYKNIDENYEEMVNIRRYLHENPEESFKEFKTAAYIAQYYDELQIPYEKNVGGNGVIATLKGNKPGKSIGLRADFDALPIQDQKDVPYKSKNPGVMHACGHDGHTATLLVLAKVMKQFQENLHGTIVFIHQHAEEVPPGGAKPILESGLLDNVDAIFGNHLWATTPLGTIETRKGPFMVGADKFEIKIKGKGGHGGYPQFTKDALVIGAEVVTQIQNILSRQLDPLKTAVITIGKFTAGTTFNVIADTATLVGTVRYLDTAVQKQVMDDLEQIIKGVCLSYGATHELDYEKGFPPVINHENEATTVIEASKNIPEANEANEIKPQMAGEDFAFYLQEKPGAFFFTGAQIEGHDYPHHHPMFDFNEKAMPIAAKMLIGTYMNYQNKF